MSASTPRPSRTLESPRRSRGPTGSARPPRQDSSHAVAPTLQPARLPRAHRAGCDHHPAYPAITAGIPPTPRPLKPETRVIGRPVDIPKF